MCIRSVIFVCLGALSFSVGLRAEWNELGWCDTPLTNLDQISSNSDTQILAQGSFHQTDAKLYLTSHALAELMPLAPTVAHALSLPGAIETRLRVTRRRCRVPHTAVRALRRLHGGTRHLQLSEVRRRRAAQTGPDAVRYPLRAALRAIARP